MTARCTCERAVREAVAEKDAESAVLRDRLDALIFEDGKVIAEKDAEIERLNKQREALLLQDYKDFDALHAEIATLTAQIAEERDHRSLAEQALRDMTRDLTIAEEIAIPVLTNYPVTAADVQRVKEMPRRWVSHAPEPLGRQLERIWNSTDSGPTDMGGGLLPKGEFTMRGRIKMTGRGGFGEDDGA
jgi:hypothetical protein